MGTNEQIEEMAKIIAEANGKTGYEDYFKPDATNLYNAGYRKASEVALEVIGEFVKALKEDERIAIDSIGLPVGMVLVSDIDYYADEFKKKYTEEGK